MSQVLAYDSQQAVDSKRNPSMKHLILSVLMAVLQAGSYAFAAPQERWILLGDSLQALVHEPAGVTPQARQLTANRIPQLVNVNIQNISTPGLTMAHNGYVWNAYDNRNVLRLIDGYYGAKGIVITLGTNDWATPSITTAMFHDQYKAVIDEAKTHGLTVVCVTPIWRADKDQYRPAGNASYQLWTFQWIATTVCQNNGAQVIDGSQAPLLPSHFTDGIHLNGVGHGVFTAWLIQQMQALGHWTAQY